MNSHDAITKTIAMIRSKDFKFDISDPENCISGAYLKAHGFGTDGETYPSIEEAFDITLSQAQNLICPEGWNSEDGSLHIPRSKDDAVAVLRHLRTTGEVRW